MSKYTLYYINIIIPYPPIQFFIEVGQKWKILSCFIHSIWIAQIHPTIYKLEIIMFNNYQRSKVISNLSNNQVLPQHLANFRWLSNLFICFPCLTRHFTYFPNSFPLKIKDFIFKFFFLFFFVWDKQIFAYSS